MVKWLWLLGVCFAAFETGASEVLWSKPLFPENGAWGVVVHTPYHGDALERLGVQWVRVNLRWKDIERNERGQYDWAASDRLLGYYLGEGFRVMAVLTVEKRCPLYAGAQDGKGVVIGAIARWAGAAALRYKGKGILWELGNEPEVFTMGGYWDDPGLYAAMARGASRAIKAADPEAKVAALSVAWMDKPFIKHALEDGLLDGGYVDVLSYHGYHRHTLIPESGLREDVAWLRAQADLVAHAPVVLADSERGYSLAEFGAPKRWDAWRNIVYTESEQAAYLARHYLETLFLGVEVAVWYKDMRGEHGYSLFYGTEEDGRGLRPMGHAYRNLALLLPHNPKRMANRRYAVEATGLPDAFAREEKPIEVRSFLYAHEGGERLVMAAWNTVEAFDGRILDSRERKGEDYHEQWRAVGPEDPASIPARLRASRIAPGTKVKAAHYVLSAETTESAWTPLEVSVVRDIVLTEAVEIAPLPVVVVLDLATAHAPE